MSIDSEKDRENFVGDMRDFFEKMTSNYYGNLKVIGLSLPKAFGVKDEDTNRIIFSVKKAYIQDLQSIYQTKDRDILQAIVEKDFYEVLSTVLSIKLKNVKLN